MSEWPQPDADKKQAHSAKLKELHEAYRGLEESLRASGLEYKAILENEAYSAAWAAYRTWYNTCAQCGSTESRVENYSMMWHDGDVICSGCDHYIRMWDAG